MRGTTVGGGEMISEVGSLLPETRLAASVRAQKQLGLTEWLLVYHQDGLPQLYH